MGKTAQLKRCYYDFADYLRTNPTGNVPYTPSLPLLYGTQESIKMLKEEGWVVTRMGGGRECMRGRLRRKGGSSL